MSLEYAALKPSVTSLKPSGPQIRNGAVPVYRGDTYFGYFSSQALSQQVGLRDAQVYEPSPAELSASAPVPYPLEAPYPDEMLRMADTIEVFDPRGGPKGLGFLRGVKQVDPQAWFFKAHFFQDPVYHNHFFP